jgi:hypothetical protein
MLPVWVLGAGWGGGGGSGWAVFSHGKKSTFETLRPGGKINLYNGLYSTLINSMEQYLSISKGNCSFYR